MNHHPEIVHQIAQGNKEAFYSLYTLYSAKVYNTAISYTQNANDAEEITQDVFVSIHKYASGFKGASSVSTWIYRITVNTSLNFLKKRNKSNFFSLTKEDIRTPDFEHPGVLLEKKEHSEILFKMLETLPETQKTAFILSYIEDLPRKEVADIMETSVKAVESLLQRAKASLREKLENLYPNRRITKK